MNLTVGIVGLGYWGPNLLRNFRALPEAHVLLACDIEPARCAKLERLYPGVAFTQDVETVLADGRIEAVAIATPVHTHHALVKRALLAQKHVLVTKPLATDVDEARELVELAESRKLVLQLDHTFIYHPAVEKLKDVINRGELGDLYYFDSVRINLGILQSDISVLWDLAPHDVSIMEYLVDRPVQWVQATGACHAGQKVESMAYITVQFTDNVLGHCHVNWLAPMKIRSVIVGGSRRMAVYDDNLVTEKVKIYDKGVTLNSAEGIYEAMVAYRRGDMYAPGIDGREALAREVRHFVHCVRHGARPLTDGRAGLRIVEILTAAQESLRNEGRRVHAGGQQRDRPEAVRPLREQGAVLYSA
jgi:predicted dehydrogenase